MANPNQLLDALALSTLDEPALIKRVAAIWCRQENRIPYNASEVAKWVKREFGPLVDKHRQEGIAKALADECKLQLRIRRRRAKRDAESLDPCTTPAGSGVRLARLLNSRLGPARRWLSQNRMYSPESPCAYIDGDVHSGLVAALVPVKMRLRSIHNPNILVYRQGWAEPRTTFVPGHITTVADAFFWLIPPAAQAFVSMPEVRVEHDGDEQAVRLVTPWGTKTLAWRGLASPTE
ncbi:MAG: hypothetical protein AB7L09_02160 [Nitrospira sp.]